MDDPDGTPKDSTPHPPSLKQQYFALWGNAPRGAMGGRQDGLSGSERIVQSLPGLYSPGTVPASPIFSTTACHAVSNRSVLSNGRMGMKPAIPAGRDLAQGSAGCWHSRIYHSPLCAPFQGCLLGSSKIGRSRAKPCLRQGKGRART